MSNIIELSDDGKVAIEMLRYHRAKIAEHKEAEAQYRAVVEAEMGDVFDVATVDGQEVVTFKHVKSNRLDTAALKAADPLTYGTYCKTSESRRFVVVER